MSYVVLARKWRPMTFADLVGQEHVAETLANAIKSGRVAHAFLFTGVRGVGKTTSARIMAKALNCLASDGPTSTPCLECAACREITDGTDMDVQEIDGASYNGVDEVRRLQESLPYRPSRDRFKVVIVDEVHMLSQSAWNAFLKTLEEPPPHVKFIFATTEVHKVPVTILSRLQRFDFKLIPTRLIVERLSTVLAAEKIEAEEAALTIIAREAAGSMRDAMSLLDQVIAWSDQRLSEADVTRVLGVASRKVLYDIAAAVIAGDPAAPLLVVDQLANQGFDLGHVARDLLAVFRDVVVCASVDSPHQLLDLPEDERGSVEDLAKHPVDDLLRLHQGFSTSYDDVVRSSHPRSALEMLLVRLCRRPPLVPIDDLIERLIKLEKRLHSAGRSGGGPAGPGRDRGASPVREPGQHPTRPSATAERSRAEEQSPAGTKQERSQRSVHAVPPRLSASDPEPVEASAPPLSPPPATGPGDVASPAAASAGEPIAAVPPSSESQRPASAPVFDRAAPTLPASDRAAASSRQAPASRSSTSLEGSSDLDASARADGPTRRPTAADDAPDAVERWRQIVDSLRDTDAKLGAFLDHAEVVAANATLVHVRYERGGMAEMALKEASSAKAVIDAAERLFGARPQFVHELTAAPANGQSVFSVDKHAREASVQAALDDARNHPVLLEAVRVLGARIKSIDLPKD